MTSKPCPIRAQARAVPLALCSRPWPSSPFLPSSFRALPHWLPKVRFSGGPEFGHPWQQFSSSQKPKGLDPSFQLLLLPGSQFPHLSHGLRGEKCCCITAGGPSRVLVGPESSTQPRSHKGPEFSWRDPLPPGLPVT